MHRLGKEKIRGFGLVLGSWTSLCLLDYKKPLIFPRQPPNLYGNPDTLSERCLLQSPELV